MTPVTFDQANVVFAKDQPEYLQLPALVQDNSVISCWEFSAEDLAELNKNKRLWVTVLTFGDSLQPLGFSLSPPFAILPG